MSLSESLRGSSVTPNFCMDTKLLKFEALVKKIHDALGGHYHDIDFDRKYNIHPYVDLNLKILERMDNTTPIKQIGTDKFNNANYLSPNFPLNLIYDLKKMNEYACIIFLYSDIFSEFFAVFTTSSFDFDEWCRKWLYNELSEAPENKKIELTNEFIDIINKYSSEHSKVFAINFLFWALFVLAVDDNEKEKHLSEICDYARIFNVTDDEMIGIVNVVKYIVQDETFDISKTECLSEYFHYFPPTVRILELYDRN